MEWWKDIKSGTLRAAVGYFWLHVGLPYGLPLMAGIAGWWFDKLPLMYCLLGGGVMYATIMVGLSHYVDYIQKTSPAEKLVLLSPFVAFDTEDDPVDHAKKISRVQLGAVTANHAPFAMAYEVEKLTTSVRLDGEAFDRKPPDNPIFTPDLIEIGVGKGFRDSRIELGGTKKNFIAVVDFRLRYGAPGKTKYVIDKKMKIEGSYNPVFGCTWGWGFIERTT